MELSDESPSSGPSEEAIDVTRVQSTSREGHDSEVAIRTYKSCRAAISKDCTKVQSNHSYTTVCG